MKRVIAAVAEWLALRRRVREEFEFHVERAAAELELLGLTERTARQSAKRRLGGRGFLVAARRELGADWRGLWWLLNANGVPGSPLYQPAVMLLGAVALLVFSPSAVLTMESVIGTPLGAADRESVFVSRQARNLTYQGVTATDLAVIRSLPDFVSVEAYGKGHLRGRLRPGATVSRVEEELRRQTGNLRVTRWFDRSPVVMAPAHVVWCVLLAIGLFGMRDQFRGALSAGYIAIAGVAHVVASLVLWAVGVQWWLSVGWRTDGIAAVAFVVLLFGYVGCSLAQLRWWVRDVQSRCPRCFAKLLLAVTTGTERNILVDQAVTESLCSYGHGTLQRDCWNRRFRSLAAALCLTTSLYGQFPAGDSAVSIARDHFQELIQRGAARAGGFAEISDSGVNMAMYGDAGEGSLWRAASTSKAFTALMILRLAERGRLELDAEANRYLKQFSIPKGITVRDLLGHTSGLDDPFVDSAYLAGEQPPLTQVMKARVPRQVFERGEARLYSNYGYGILGAIIEEVTGQDYAAFLQAEVLVPIGMKSSTFRQPLPKAMEERVAPTVERSVFGMIRPGAILYHRAVAAGGLTVTLEDLAVFARFIQNGAKVDGRPFVSADSLAVAVGERDDSPGYGFGFGRNRGERYWYAGGDLGGSHTVILWFPEHRRAMVIVAASYSEMATWGLVPKVMKKWFGEPKAAARANGGAGEGTVDGADLAGTYRPVRYPHSDMGKTFLAGMDRVMRRNDDGSFAFQGERWRAVDGLRLRHVAEDRYLTFRWTRQGQLVVNREFERVSWYATGRAGIAGYFGFLFVALVTRWFSRGRRELRFLQWTATGVAVHSVAWLSAVLIADPQRLILGLPWYVSATQGIAVVCAVLWVLMVAAAIQRWRGVLLLASVVFGLYFPFLWYWRIV